MKLKKEPLYRLSRLIPAASARHFSETELDDIVTHEMAMEFAKALVNELEVVVTRITQEDGDVDFLYEANVHIMTPKRLEYLLTMARRGVMWELSADNALKNYNSKTIN